MSVLSDIFGNDVICLIKEYMLYFGLTTYHLYHSFRAKFNPDFRVFLGRFVLWDMDSLGADDVDIAPMVQVCGLRVCISDYNNNGLLKKRG